MPNIEAEPEDVTNELEAFDESAESASQEPGDDVTIDMSEESNDLEVPAPKSTPGGSRISRFVAWCKTHKKISIPLTILAVLAVLLAIPFTRYVLLGPFVKKDVTVTITDSENHIPVSGVDVALQGKTAKTDGQGNATLKQVSVGPGTLTATKKYYKDYQQSVTVTVTKMKQVAFTMQATGRPIPVKVTNTITGSPIAAASVKVSDAEGETDQNGAVTLVLPADKQTQTGTVSAKGYNDMAITVDLNKNSVSDNSFTLTPSGKVYFLSKRTGKIDVVKTNLDGSDRQVVLAGTGGEEDNNTILLASRDWKYLALLSRRDNGQTRLYLITTADDSVTEMDSGDVTFNPIGWTEHSFIYTANRYNNPQWQAKGSALKSYSADTKQNNVIDETNAEGTSVNDYVNEQYGNVYIMKDQVVYVKQWINNYYSAYRLAGKRSGLYQAKANGSNKQTIKDFDAATVSSISTLLAKPQELYVATYENGGKTSYYEYSNGNFAAANDINSDSFNAFYPTYLVSPSGNTVFWGEPRDGKNTLFTANLQLDSPKQLATGSDFSAYGWFTDNFVLLSKNGSELYVAPSTGISTTPAPVKITDYHKPARNFDGYGYGYGGQ